MNNSNSINIIGGGLAGCECAYQLAKRGFNVVLYEMRGIKNTPCHKTDKLAELVCSNSLKSESLDTASGMLKQELTMLGCLLLQCAVRAKVPAGGALAVDRDLFSKAVEEELAKFSNLKIVREEVENIDLSMPTIIASGPLTSDKLSQSIAELIGKNYLHFYDAVAPIINADSINYDKAFFGARYDKGDKDYLNCAMNKEEYLVFYNELINAQRAELKEYEKNVFEGCMPIEVMASRGEDTMRFGPLRPVGIRNPLNDTRPYAVVQLRKENAQGTIYNIVGFQTNLTFGEQRRVFSLIPGLENMEILRYGVMHRNTYINAPDILQNDWSTKGQPLLFFAGQMTGVEGYMESIASGLMSGINMARKLQSKQTLFLPESTIIGAFQRHISSPSVDYQPMNSNFGILPILDNPPRDKKLRKQQYTQRGLQQLTEYLQQNID